MRFSSNDLSSCTLGLKIGGVVGGLDLWDNESVDLGGLGGLAELLIIFLLEFFGSIIFAGVIDVLFLFELAIFNICALLKIDVLTI